MTDMTGSMPFDVDLVVIGGGINGAGIAADAAGRGLKVLLAEMGDLGSATSSASSKLIHGGLRYLEQYSFRLVREALQEREVLLRAAPHLVSPLRFVMPHVPEMRSALTLRAGLFLYDHLARRERIPASGAIDLGSDLAGRPLKPELKQAFEYWDCWVDDARLVIANARAAANRGASICTRTRVSAVHRDGQSWLVGVEVGGTTSQIRARAVVNAAGPWADSVRRLAVGSAGPGEAARLKLVKGSHIVVPRVAGADSAYLFQNSDGRVVFVLPFEQRFTLIGTTDVAFEGDARKVAISDAETSYLLAAVNRYLAQSLATADIVWSYSGVRPLTGGGEDDPSSVSRDYRLELDGSLSEAPLLSVLGGKVTTYRRLAEEALAVLAPWFPGLGPKWTAAAHLPGGDIDNGGMPAFLSDLKRRYPKLVAATVQAIARRHGSETGTVLGDAKSEQDLGPVVCPGLTARELAVFKDREWAQTADDVLWRRSKIGLHLGTDAARANASGQIEDRL